MLENRGYTVTQFLGRTGQKPSQPVLQVEAVYSVYKRDWKVDREMTEKMEGEIYNYFKACLCIFFSLTYSFLISRTLPRGLPRLLLLLPVVFLFLLLPLDFTSIHLGGSLAVLISWLANFKLLLLAFDKGPWSSDRSISLVQFLAICCLPFRIADRHQHSQPPSINRSKSDLNRRNRAKVLAKGLLLGVLICAFVFEFMADWNRNLVLFNYCLFIYLLLETLLAIVAATVCALTGVELEPSFNEPYLSTSLQDFWGNRWNLVVSEILRLTVYEPCRELSSSFMKRKWAPLPAVIATFAVSGLMHELIYFYFGRVWPTWEVTCFFILNGLSLTVEILLKKTLAGKFRLPGFISGPLTVGFVLITSFRLFLPQFLRSRSDARMFDEYAAIGAFLKKVTLSIISDPESPIDL